MKNKLVRNGFFPAATSLDRGRIDMFAWISVLWVILTSGGAYYNSAGVVNVVLLVSVVLFILQLSFCWRVIKRAHGKVLIYAALSAALVFLSMIANSDYSSFLSYARIVVVIFLALTTVLFLGVDQFLVRCVHVIFLVAIISLVLFYSQILPNFSSIFPTFVSNEYSYLNAFLYSEIDGAERRNAGPFIEPGLFQIYINFALALVLFGVVRVKEKIFYIFIFLVSIFSTNSTTGFILLLSSVLLSLGLREKGNGAAVVVKYALLVGVVLFAIYSDYVTSNIEDKFTNEVNMSFVTRFNSTLIDLAVIQENPFFGGGAGEYGSHLSYYDARGLVVDAATNTFTQLGAYIGIGIVLLFAFRSIVFFFCAFSHARTGLAFLLWYLISFSTEPFLFFPFFYVFSFLSFLLLGSSERR